MSSSAKFSIIDVETTGLRAKDNRVIEIAVINVDGNRIVESFETLINPERSLSPMITKITGIKEEDLRNAPRFFEIAKRLVLLTQDRVFVAHNARFDYEFIQEEFARLGYTFRRKNLCTVRLARKAFPGLKSYSLGKLCKELGIEQNQAHRAMADTRATLELFQKIRSKERGGVEKPHYLPKPPQLDMGEVEKLPESTGVYLFYGSNGQALYVGKSRNIRQRVRNHLFTRYAGRKAVEFQNSIAKVDFVETGSELLALILEAHWIKEQRPYYNQAMKRKDFRYGVRLDSEHGLEISMIKNEPYLRKFTSRKSAQAFVERVYEELGITSKDLNQEELERLQEFSKIYDYPHDSFVIQEPGRQEGENALLFFEERKFKGYAFASSDTLNLDDVDILPFEEDQDTKKIILGELFRKELTCHPIDC